MRAQDAFDGRSARLTTEYQDRLLTLGHRGQLAYGLFRAQKRSTVAKRYRRQHRRTAYEAKNETLTFIDAALSHWADELRINWGWSSDENQEYHRDVLYVDLPHGQVSFHSMGRASEKTYDREWDQQHKSLERILTYCDDVFIGEEPRSITGHDLMPFGSWCGTPLGELKDSQVEGLAGWEGIGGWPNLLAYLKKRCGTTTGVQ